MYCSWVHHLFSTGAVFLSLMKLLPWTKLWPLTLVPFFRRSTSLTFIWKPLPQMKKRTLLQVLEMLLKTLKEFFFRFILSFCVLVFFNIALSPKTSWITSGKYAEWLYLILGRAQSDIQFSVTKCPVTSAIITSCLPFLPITMLFPAWIFGSVCWLISLPLVKVHLFNGNGQLST